MWPSLQSFFCTLLLTLFASLPLFASSPFPALIPGERPPSLTQISNSDYEELRDLSLPIYRTLKERNALGVGIGRSGTPIIQFIKNLEKGRASNLPMTGFGRAYAFRRYKIVEAEEAIFQNFDRYLPSESKRKGREIIFIDFVSDGNTFRFLNDYFPRYLKSRRLRMSWGVIGYGTPRALSCFESVLWRPNIYHSFHLISAFGNLTNHFIDKDFHFYSEFEAHVLTAGCVTALKSKKERWNYLGEMLEAHMSTDPELAEFYKKK